MIHDLKEKFESIEKALDEIEKASGPDLEKMERAPLVKKASTLSFDDESDKDESVVEEIVVWRKASSKFHKPIRVESFNLTTIQKRFESNINSLNNSSRITYEYQIPVPTAGMAAMFEDVTDNLFENRELFASTPQGRYRIRVWQEKSGNLSWSVFTSILPREVKARDGLLRELYRVKCRIESLNKKCKILHNHRLIERSTIFGIQVQQKAKKKEKEYSVNRKGAEMEI